MHELFLRDVARGRRVIFFTRHGESVANVADRELQPRPDDADSLSTRGWEQARGVGERLRGEGIEAIIASHYRRAQETASAIGEVLGLAFETDPDLHEVRQADAYYTSAPEYGDTGSITWMPSAERDFAQPGAESFDAILARVDRVQERLAARDDTVLCVSHWGFMHFFLGRTIFRDEFAPAPPAGAVPDLARQHRDHDLRAARGLRDRRRRLQRLGVEDLERPGPPLTCIAYLRGLAPLSCAATSARSAPRTSGGGIAIG